MESALTNLLPFGLLLRARSAPIPLPANSALWLRSLVFLALLGPGILHQALPAEDESAKPGINEKFLANPKPPEWVERFEREGREIYDQRDAVVAACAISSGDRIADIGAGTGLYTRLFAPAVGEEGKVFAVDIAKTFVDHTVASSHEQGWKQVEGVVCARDDVKLPANSIDLAFVCATYHHFEYPFKTLESIRRALRPGGRL
ncbi:MAG: class I SAM-dependent methyltransferase, partial [Verrucomicrobiales bacterium]